MWYYPQAVVVNDRVYVGGGKSSSDVEAQTVMFYEPQHDVWNTLLQCYMCVKFAMSVIKNVLVLVGGEEVQTEDVTNMLGVWDETMQGWTHPFPPMHTACDAASAVTYGDQWLVVVGGQNSRGEDLSKVEILDTSSGQWYYGAPLPQPCSHLSAAVIGDRLFLLGGFIRSNPSKRVLYVRLSDLISQAISRSPTSPTSSPWQTLPDTHHVRSTALTLGGTNTLLAVGGGISGNGSIHMYQPSSGNWIEVGILPTARRQCVCATLPSGELFIAGGGSVRIQLQVDIATVFLRYNPAH